MRLLLPLLLALVGAGAGVGAGLYLRPDPTPAAAAEPDGAPADGAETAAGDAGSGPAGLPEAADPDYPGVGNTDFVRMSNQFVVPVLKQGRISALVVLSLSLETATGMREMVFAREPKLRDAFLQVLFDHANAGAFDGNFTETGRIDSLRRSLREAARPIVGTQVYDVLITDIARQDS
jgi:hypothetical protein